MWDRYYSTTVFLKISLASESFLSCSVAYYVKQINRELFWLKQEIKDPLHLIIIFPYPSAILGTVVPSLSPVLESKSFKTLL